MEHPPVGTVNTIKMVFAVVPTSNIAGLRVTIQPLHVTELSREFHRDPPIIMAVTISGVCVHDILVL